MDEDRSQTRRSFAKSATIGLGLIPRGFGTEGNPDSTVGDVIAESSDHYTQNIAEWDLQNPFVGLTIRVLWPHRIRTMDEFAAHDINVRNRITSPLRKLSGIIRRAEAGDVTVYDGTFERSRVKSILKGRGFSHDRDIGPYTLMNFAGQMVAFTDGVAIEGNYYSKKYALRDVRSIIDRRKQVGVTGDPTPEVQTIMAELDTGYFAIANFIPGLVGTYPMLEPFGESLQGVGQSATPYLGEVENRSAILFDSDPAGHLDELRSLFSDPTGFKYLNYHEPEIEANGRVITVTETLPASEAITL